MQLASLLRSSSFPLSPFLFLAAHSDFSRYSEMLRSNGLRRPCDPWHMRVLLEERPSCISLETPEIGLRSGSGGQLRTSSLAQVLE